MKTERARMEELFKWAGQLAVITCASLASTTVDAQTSGPLAIQWDKSYGAPGQEDILYDLVAADDGGLLLVGCTVEYSGSGLAESYWHPRLVRLDSGGNLLWEKAYGGSETDIVISSLPMADGGLVLGGFSNSPDGDRSWPCYGDLDFAASVGQRRAEGLGQIVRRRLIPAGILSRAHE